MGKANLSRRDGKGITLRAENEKGETINLKVNDEILCVSSKWTEEMGEKVASCKVWGLPDSEIFSETS